VRRSPTTSPANHVTSQPRHQPTTSAHPFKHENTTHPSPWMPNPLLRRLFLRILLQQTQHASPTARRVVLRIVARALLSHRSVQQRCHLWVSVPALRRGQ